MWLKLHRRSRKLLIALAVLPLFQGVGACDSATIANTLVSTAIGIGSQFNVAIFQSFIGGVQTTLLENFPSMDILQILFGTNRRPFFN